jgi:hypothetical protein
MQGRKHKVQRQSPRQQLLLESKETKIIQDLADTKVPIKRHT